MDNFYFDPNYPETLPSGVTIKQEFQSEDTPEPDLDSYQFETGFLGMEDWRYSSLHEKDEDHSKQNSQQLLSYSCSLTNTLNPENPTTPKLFVFGGEFSQTRIQRAEITIPTENGMRTQAVLLLPLKQRDKIKVPEETTVADNSPSLDQSHTQLPQTPDLPIMNTKSILGSPELPSNPMHYSFELRNGPEMQRYQESIPAIRQIRATKPGRVIHAPNTMRILAESFKQRRERLGLSQSQAATALKEVLGPTFSLNAIRRFEKLELSPAKFWKMQPLLQDWMTEVEKLAMS